MGFGIWSPRLGLRLVFLFVILGYLASVQSQEPLEGPVPKGVNRKFTREEQEHFIILVKSFADCAENWAIPYGGKCDNATAANLLKKTIDKYTPSGGASRDWIYFAPHNEVRVIALITCGSNENGFVCKVEGCRCTENGNSTTSKKCDPNKIHVQDRNKNCDKELIALQNFVNNSTSEISSSIIIMFLAAACLRCVRVIFGSA